MYFTNATAAAGFPADTDGSRYGRLNGDELNDFSLAAGRAASLTSSGAAP
jgi:hypothetical protein